MCNLFLLIRGVITGATHRDIARLPEILQPFCQSAVTYAEVLSTATNTKLFVIEIILDCIQLKLFVMLLCHNEILLQYNTSIVSCIVYLEFSHFDLQYLDTSTIVSDFRIVVKQTFRKTESKGLFLIAYFEKTLTHLNEVKDRASIFRHFREGGVVYCCNWWGTMPMAMFTFLERCDLAGKRIFPFCTNEGSGMGGSERDLKRICKGAIVEKGLSIHGAEAADSRSKVENWVKKQM